MAALDYYGIEINGIQRVLDDHALIGGANPRVRTFIEDAIMFSAEMSPAVYIYAMRRDAVVTDQRLAAGRRTDMTIRFSLWCVDVNFESIAAASKGRDELIGNVEIALMENRTLNSLVKSSWLEGGAFETGGGDNGFISAGEVVLIATANAVV